MRVILPVLGRTVGADGLPVEGDAGGFGVEGDDAVAHGLVHVAVEVLFLLIRDGSSGRWGRIVGYGRRRACPACAGSRSRGGGEEVSQGHDPVAVLPAVKQGIERVLAAGDEGDYVQPLRLW